MLDPGYAIHVFVCEHQRPAGDPRGCCADKQSHLVREWFKESMSRHGIKAGNRVNRAGCLDHCALGPTVVVYPEGVWYSPKTRADVEEIVVEHFLGGRPVQRLRLQLPPAAP